MGKNRNREWWSVAELVKHRRLLGMSKQQVLALIGSGDLKASNFGAGRVRPRWRVSDAEVARFCAARVKSNERKRQC